jgi:hypothetical protein
MKQNCESSTMWMRFTKEEKNEILSIIWMWNILHSYVRIQDEQIYYPL